jgi:hypothetical protein
MMSRALLAVTFLIAALGFATARQGNPAQGDAVPASALALIPKAKPGDTLHMVTNVASFKILPKGDELPSGRLDFSFEGTVLVTGLEPGSYLKTEGKIRKEYEDKAHGKQVFFGKGRILIVGKFSNCQWFGRNLDFTFKGSGSVRMITEYDSNLKTGKYWFNPEKKEDLQPTLMGIPVPNERRGPPPAITREEYEAQKKKLKGGG